MAADRRIAPATSNPTGVGQRLRAARQQRGITLQEISQSTKIPVSMLEALEHDNPSRLPGGIFSRAFVRSFASAVGLDPEDVLADFQRAFQDDTAPDVRRIEDTPPKADGRLWPLLLLVVGLVIIVALAVAGFRGYGPDVRSVWQRIQGPPQATLGGEVQQAPSAEAGAASPPAPAEPTGNTPAPSSPGAPVPVEAGAETGSAPADTKATEPPPASPAPAPATTAAPPGAAAPAAATPPPPAPVDGLVRLSIQPAAPCWVRVTADGAVRLSRLVAAGEKVDFAPASRVQLEVGDAGAFAYSIDGRPGRPLGSSGRVVRVTIDAATAAGFAAP